MFPMGYEANSTLLHQAWCQAVAVASPYQKLQMSEVGK